MTSIDKALSINSCQPYKLFRWVFRRQHVSRISKDYKDKEFNKTVKFFSAYSIFLFFVFHIYFSNACGLTRVKSLRFAGIARMYRWRLKDGKIIFELFLVHREFENYATIVDEILLARTSHSGFISWLEVRNAVFL